MTLTAACEAALYALMLGLVIGGFLGIAVSALASAQIYSAGYERGKKHAQEAQK
jgi:hypothetical protein